MKPLFQKSAFRVFLVFVSFIVNIMPCIAYANIFINKDKNPAKSLPVTTRVISPSGSNVVLPASDDSLSILTMYGVSYKKSEHVFTHTTIQTPGSTTLNLISGDPAPQNCFCTCIKKVTLRMEFDAYGDHKDFRHATSSWNSVVHFEVYLDGSSSIAFDKYLSISNTQPQQVFEEDITSYIGESIRCRTLSTTDYEIYITCNYDTPPTSSDVEPDIRLRAHLVSEMQVNPSSSCSTASPLGYETTIQTITEDNPIRLEWAVTPPSSTSECFDVSAVPNYQIQILKLYNKSSEPLVCTDEKKIRDTVHWNNALTFETYSPIRHVDLTLAEGRGFYIWRIRPIGNIEENGIANPKNWGDWSKNYIPDGAIVEFERDVSNPTDTVSLVNGITSSFTISTASSPVLSDYNKRGVFFYRQFDKDRNWIFSRTFTEGSTEHGPQFNEKIVYANRLLQPIQEQVALLSKDNILVSYTGYDFAGRPVLKTLPAPLPSRHFSYVKSVLSEGTDLQMYSAFKFDNTLSGVMATNAASMDNIHTSSGGSDPTIPSIGSYYSSINPDLTIPSAEGFPFSQVLYDSDPLGRVAEQSGVGEDFKLGSGKTVRTQYSSVPANELISIFGDEAPDNLSAFKTITTDPNGVTSIAYTTADGKTVATCLVKNELSSTISNTNPLLELHLATSGSDGEVVNNVDVVDVAVGNMPSGENQYTSYTTFVLTKTTSCTLDYEIARKKVQLTGEECPGFCKYCDYNITLLLTKDGESTPVYSHTITADDLDCTHNGTNTDDESVELGAGRYTLTRIIRANPLVTESGKPTKTRMESYVDKLTDAFRPITDATLWSIFGSTPLTKHFEKWKYAGTQDPDEYFMDLYDELMKNYRVYRHSKLSAGYVTHPPAPSSELMPSFTCYNINLPEVDAACTSPCFDPVEGGPNAHPDFEKFLPDNDGNPLNTKDISSLFKVTVFTAVEHTADPVYGNETSVTLSTLDQNPLFGTSTNGFINTIMENMISDGYSCTKLWRCWQGVLSGYTASKDKSVQFPEENPTDATPDPSSMSKDQNKKKEMDKMKFKPENSDKSNVKNDDYDILESFLGCAGRKFCRPATSLSEYLQHPYEVIRVDGEYGKLYTQCVKDLFGITPTVPLACDPMSTDPTHPGKVHDNLSMVWECMKAKIYEAVTLKRSETPGTKEYKIRAGVEKDFKSGGDKYPACCVPVPISGSLTIPPEMKIEDIPCCILELEKKFGGSCEKECAEETANATRSLIKQYEDNNYLLEDKFYPGIGTAGYTPKAGFTMPTGYTFLSKFVLSCMTANIKKYCESQCKLTIEIDEAGGIQYIKKVGTPEEHANRRIVFSHNLEVIPKPSEGPCPESEGYIPLVNSVKIADILVEHLNEIVEELRKTVLKSPGEWRDVYPYIQPLFELYSLDASCKSTLFSATNAFVFIDKAAPNQGKNKFVATKKLISSSPDVYQCGVAFRHDVKYFKVDRMDKSKDLGYPTLTRSKRWEAEYEKYVNNQLSASLNKYIYYTWASHQDLWRDFYDNPPSDSSTNLLEFLHGSSCSNLDLIRSLRPLVDTMSLSNPNYPSYHSWFYKWNPPLGPTPFYARKKVGYYYDGYFYETSEHLGYARDNSVEFIDNTELKYMNDLSVNCINGSDHSVTIRQFVEPFSTQNYAFYQKTPIYTASRWFEDYIYNDLDFDEDGIEPFTGGSFPRYRSINLLNNHETANGYGPAQGIQLFERHVYLGKLGLKFKDPNSVITGTPNENSFEMWMDNPTISHGTGPNGEDIFSTIFRLHLNFGGVGGTPDSRYYDIPYPSATFDKLVYAGYPDPLGCENLDASQGDAPWSWSYMAGDYPNNFGVIGGFYVNDNGYLAFHDAEAGATTLTHTDYVFSNIQLNCYDESCMPNEIMAFCLPCDETGGCNNLCVRWVKPPEPPITTKFRLRSCEENEMDRIIDNIQSQLAVEHKKSMDTLRARYTRQCVRPDNIADKYTATYNQKYYHYTLYYYDRAGRLVKTIPPKGLLPITTGLRDETHHTFATEYKYNSLGQMVWQNTPDGGETNFWYDEKGKLRLSQNAHQAVAGTFSYIKYDDLYRIVDVGEAVGTPSQGIADTPDDPGTGYTVNEYTKTYYTDKPPGDLPPPFDAGGALPREQKFMLNRVSWTDTKAKGSSEHTRSYYSYDPHGNVEWLIQEIPGLGASVIDYEYDLISGKVTEVKYQDKFNDRFYHRYAYDQDNRITSVETSKDTKIWEKDAEYDYYEHGPLRRVVTGQDEVQGTDFTYTVQGWLKAINHPLLTTTATTGGNDPGKDGYTSISSKVGVDAFGMSLTYYSGDFKHTSSAFNSSSTSALTPAITAGLYNGNIAGWVTGYRNNSAAPSKPLAGIYTYDLLNRIRIDAPKQWTVGTPSGSWGTVGYGSTYNYDPNGNILTLTRKDNRVTGGVQDIDNLAYNYNSNTNKLNYITDDILNNPKASYDIDRQSANNYSYDEIGNIIGDAKEGISSIEWTAAGKVSKVTKSTGTEISFLYDGMGNRVRKFLDIGGSGSTSSDKTTWYVRNASGSVMGTYEQSGNPTTQPIKLIEVPLYGSDRLGMAKPDMTRDNGGGGGDNLYVGTTDIFSRTLSNKVYEFTDHLGNVRTVISDRKSKASDNAYVFVPTVVSYSNYYPFGMQMNEDTYSSNTYRYGYNGQEMDKDINSTGNITTAEFWEYDSRTGRRWNRDPKPSVSVSEYASFAGNPIKFSDPKGDTIIVDNLGEIKKNDGKDKLVFTNGQKGKLIPIGELGKKIDLTSIYQNILDKNSKEAEKITGNWMSIWKQYADRVATGGVWDYKGRKGNIIGLAFEYNKSSGVNNQTEFTFGEEKRCTPSDLGNYHAGYVGKYLNNRQGIDDINLFMGAGMAEGAKSLFTKHDIVEGLGRFSQSVIGRFLPDGEVFRFQFYSSSTLPHMFNSYGDIERDFIMNSRGIEDAKQNISKGK